jgi:hypothetical protein
MSVLSTRVFTVVAIVLAVPAASATAQTQPPIPSQTAPPEIVRPQPTLPMERQTMPSGKVDAAAHAALVGLVAFSSDGQKLGSVQNVSTGPDGKTVIFLRTGGFLGFGARIVAVPEARFTRSGDFIQLGMTVQEVSQLPEAKD